MISNTMLTTTNHFQTGCSAREIQIINLISQEHTTSEIASKLFISESTVDSHRRRIFIKLGVKNAAGLVRRSFEIGILNVPSRVQNSTIFQS